MEKTSEGPTNKEQELDKKFTIVEQQALSDFSVTKCILAEPANSSNPTAGTCCSTEQLEKNVNNNNILPTATTVAAVNVKQEGGDTTLSDEDASDEESGHTEDGEDSEERPKVKRTRTAYSNYQLDQLELVFSQTHYPDVFLREELSARLGISESRLQVWFQNRRARWRKQQRTGSVGVRSRYRQRHLQNLQQQANLMRINTAAAAYNSFLPTGMNGVPSLPYYSATSGMTSPSNQYSTFLASPMSTQSPSPYVSATTSHTSPNPLYSTFPTATPTIPFPTVNTRL